MLDAVTQELLSLTQRLLDAIVSGDWETYQSLCDPSLSAHEPEVRGLLVEGMAFHQFYFTQLPRSGAPQATICAPHVRLLGDSAAVVRYVRLVQSADATREPRTRREVKRRACGSARAASGSTSTFIVRRRHEGDTRAVVRPSRLARSGQRIAERTNGRRLATPPAVFR